MNPNISRKNFCARQNRCRIPTVPTDAEISSCGIGVWQYAALGCNDKSSIPLFSYFHPVTIPVDWFDYLHLFLFRQKVTVTSQGRQGYKSLFAIVSVYISIYHCGLSGPNLGKPTL